MRSSLKLKALSAMLLLGAGFLLAGCKSAPPLTKAEAQTLIQAKYDQAPPSHPTIVVNDLGMRQGAAAGYWKRTLIFPNRYWANFELTHEGQKLVTLQGGGKEIKWRPMNPTDSHFTVTLTTTAANRLKVLSISNIAPETLAGASKAMGVDYVEGVSFKGLPAPLVQIGQNPGNQLSTQRHADFALVNGAWKLQSIE